MSVASLLRRLARLENIQEDNSRWGYPGEETIVNYPWYVSPGMIEEDKRREAAGLDSLIDRGCLNVTLYWLEEQECLAGGGPPMEYHGHYCEPCKEKRWW